VRRVALFFGEVSVSQTRFAIEQPALTPDLAKEISKSDLKLAVVRVSQRQQELFDRIARVALQLSQQPV
jgi:hypothetical protein